MADNIQLKEKRKKWEEKRKNDPIRIEYMKQLQKQPHIIKSKKIGVWKRRGVVNDDFDNLYENYLTANNCERCGIIFDDTNKEKSRCLDHDHITGYFRAFLCNTCNWVHMRKNRTIHRVPLVITDRHYNCDCGSIVLKLGKKAHEKTNIHLSHLT